MIRQPRKGQRVRLHYRASTWLNCPHQGRTGVVDIVSKPHGSGRRAPLNAYVEFDGGGWTIVPRGNLVAIGGNDEQS